MQCKSLDSFFSMWLSIFFSIICWKTVLSPLNSFGALVENNLTLCIKVFFLENSLIPLSVAKSLGSCPTLCSAREGSPPGSPLPGTLQARTLEWVVISFSNAWKWKVKVKSLSYVRLSVTPWTAAHQAPLSMGFSRQEYWSGVPLPSPKVKPNLHF